jgi:hypothetical protein
MPLFKSAAQTEQPADRPAEQETVPPPAPEKPMPEPTTVPIKTEALAEVLGQALHVVARFGTDTLGKDGHGAYLRVLNHINSDGYVPDGFYDIDARDAYRLVAALMETRVATGRMAPTRGETELCTSVTAHAPDLVARLSAAAEKRPQRLPQVVMPERPRFEYEVVTAPGRDPMAGSGYFDDRGRRIGR